MLGEDPAWSLAWQDFSFPRGQEKQIHDSRSENQNLLNKNQMIFLIDSDSSFPLIRYMQQVLDKS